MMPSKHGLGKLKLMVHDGAGKYSDTRLNACGVFVVVATKKCCKECIQLIVRNELKKQGNYFTVSEY